MPTLRQRALDAERKCLEAQEDAKIARSILKESLVLGKILERLIQLCVKLGATPIQISEALCKIEKSCED